MVRLVAEGMKNREIAESLQVTKTRSETISIISSTSSGFRRAFELVLYNTTHPGSPKPASEVITGKPRGRLHASEIVSSALPRRRNSKAPVFLSGIRIGKTVPRMPPSKKYAPVLPAEPEHVLAFEFGLIIK